MRTKDGKYLVRGITGVFLPILTHICKRTIVFWCLILTACGPISRDVPDPVPTVLTDTPVNSIDTIISDMQIPHDARPHGVPSNYDWAVGPRMGYGNEPPAEWSAIIPWGQVYECAEGNAATNTRVQIRNLRLYVLSKRSGAWTQVQYSPSVQGAAYREDFQGDVNQPADERPEPDGGLSVMVGSGYNYHFFTTRETIDPTDIGGVFATVEARLIRNDSRQPDDRAQACYLLSMGADYWRSLDAQWNAAFKNNGDVAIGRFKRIANEWQAFNMISLSPAEVRANPPPIMNP